MSNEKNIEKNSEGKNKQEKNIERSASGSYRYRHNGQRSAFPMQVTNKHKPQT